ncbi:type I restriction enzyme HsdR N-terminal domain-containing protein (plasmid) [Haloplanus ruber]|uniref:Type I restriction enzyme HsdR N-terminal domain-containing protein n=1 Tax=Haloplanus ruber TaxID=869892 RepID=A0ABD6D1G6_9EURY|nr:type I restriction enzyme HsdR N-terminal domain-containing protein [Haloplanus ruber]
MTEGPRGGAYGTLSEFVSVTKGVVATGQSLDETNTKAKIVTPFIRTLGWRVYDNSEVLLEYSGEEGFDDQADYALFGPDGVHAVVEAKQIGRNITNSGAQIRRYMRLFGAEWGLLTNGEQYRLYQATDEDDEQFVESVSLADLPSSAHIEDLMRQSVYTEDTAGSPSDEESPEVPSESRERIEEFVNEKRSNDQEPIQQSTFGPLYDSLIESIAPSVYGHEMEKFGLLLSLVGGIHKPRENGRSIRGAIHISLVHDSGTLTTDIAEYAAQVAPSGVHLSGGPSGKGLLTTQKSPHDSSSRRLSEYSVDTLTRASHAVVTQFGKANENELDQLRRAFTAEIPSDKAGANQGQTGLIATSKPKYGRFDQYEPIAEQIDIDPTTVSQFDLVFTVVDRPDPEEDIEAAERILETNRERERDTRRENTVESEPTQSEVEEAARTAAPIVEPEFLREYISYARETYYPTLTDEGKEPIRDYYVELRAKSADEDAPVPVTGRKLEAMVRLAEASARLRLSDTVDREDAERAIKVVRSCLQDIGIDPVEGDFTHDVVETGAGREGEDATEDGGEHDEEVVESVRDVIEIVDKEYTGEAGAPIDAIVDRARSKGISKERLLDHIEQLRRKGDVYSPSTDQYKVV